MAVTEVDVSSPGFGRRRAGKGFTYVDCECDRITDADVVARIKALAIPPAWQGVWVCTDPQGHIQRFDEGRTGGDAVADDVVDRVVSERLGGADDDSAAGAEIIERLPRGVVAEIERAVVDLVEGSLRRPARPARRRR